MIQICQRWKTRLKKLLRDSRKYQLAVILGARTKQELLCISEFKKLGCKVSVATEDGSEGFKGTVTELLQNLSTITYQPTTNIYACGPKAMFLALAAVLRCCPQVECEVSFEQSMGCGIGICLGCVVNTVGGYKRVCKDGPVFNLKDMVLPEAV